MRMVLCVLSMSTMITCLGHGGRRQAHAAPLNAHSRTPVYRLPFYISYRALQQRSVTPHTNSTNPVFQAPREADDVVHEAQVPADDRPVFHDEEFLRRVIDIEQATPLHCVCALVSLFCAKVYHEMCTHWCPFPLEDS